ncbi:MAG: RNA polymerase sigma factor [Deltaproteobacteria bacterium]|nr:RNA polymerase sigma factor [Deltaproteobacteria bacterium]
MTEGVEGGGASGRRDLCDIYRANVGRVHALCFRLTGSRDQAEDLTQEVFLRAFEQIESFRFESQMSTWLHRIAVNAFLQARRKAARGEPSEARAEPPASVGSPEMSHDLESAVAALPEGARTVLVLHDIEGYRHHEIAALLEVSEGTSKSQLHRARKLLREAWKR